MFGPQLIPLLALASLTMACGAQGTAKPSVRVVLDDGPYLFHGADGSVTAKWTAQGKVEQKRFAKDAAIELPRFASLLGQSLRLVAHVPEPPIWPQPEKLFVISDIEGEYAIMRRFLRGNGVVDADGRWSFGQGHLVCIGDMVDRGTQVTETLWMLYRLAREAEAQGGRLHYVLGNHEVMVMGGDVRYTAPKYKDVAQAFGIPTEGLFGADTEIGRWLRTRNSLVRVGKLLFVHAGVCPALATRKVDLVRLNDVLRSVIGVHPTKIEDQGLLALTWGRMGPWWYRGYFPDFALDFGPTPSVKTIDTILENLGAESIIIGHTKVPKIAPMFGKRRVIPIDIPWTDAKRVRGLLIRGARIDVVDIAGKQTKLD